MADGAQDAAPAAAVGVGNYKGVMLCNRPFQGAAAALAREARRPAAAGPSALDNSKAAFLAGCPGEPLGMNVPILSEPAHAVKRDRRHTALSKHRKWLHELQAERARLQAALAEDDARRRQRRDRFSEREAKLRAGRDRGANAAEDGSGEVDDNNAAAAARAARQQRPMWALTRESAEEKREDLEDAAADALLAFARDLDIDQFLDDVEIKARVAQVEQQLAQVQAMVELEEARERREQPQQPDDDVSESDARAQRPQTRSQTQPQVGESDDELGGDADADDDDDARSVANSVLSESKSMRAVHSARSVAALARRAEAKLAPTEAAAVAAPRVVTVDEEQGARMLIKRHPSNLPYIRRNPAV